MDVAATRTAPQLALGRAPRTLLRVLGAVALAAALLLPEALSTSQADGFTLAVDLAYPLCALLLLALVAGIVAVGGARLVGRWTLLAAAFGLAAIADAVYLGQVARGTYVEG